MKKNVMSRVFKKSFSSVQKSQKISIKCWKSLPEKLMVDFQLTLMLSKVFFYYHHCNHHTVCLCEELIQVSWLPNPPSEQKNKKQKMSKGKISNNKYLLLEKLVWLVSFCQIKIRFHWFTYQENPHFWSFKN